jgi:hypothetical protein
MILIALAVGLIAGAASAQDVSNLYVAGGSYNHGATPAVAGTALYAHEIGTSSTYAFTMIDALPTTTKPFAVTSNIAVGVAQRVARIGPVSVFIPTAAGVSFSGTNLGWAWTTGAGFPFMVRASAAGGGGISCRQRGCSNPR